jgi:hypothetical protein
LIFRACSREEVSIDFNSGLLSTREISSCVAGAYSIFFSAKLHPEIRIKVRINIERGE